MPKLGNSGICMEYRSVKKIAKKNAKTHKRVSNSNTTHLETYFKDDKWEKISLFLIKSNFCPI